MNISKVYFALFALVFLLAPSCSWLVTKQSPTFQTSTPALTKVEPRSASDQTTALFMQCNSPCWLGIIPGQTTHKETIATLERYYGKNNLRATDINVIDWTSNDFDISESGYVRSIDNVVTDVHVQVDENKLSVRDLINILGKPDLVFVGIYLFPTSESSCAQAEVFYPKEGVLASLYRIDGFVGVQETQYVSSLSFLSPWQSNAEMNSPGRIIAKWEGFRNYCPDK